MRALITGASSGIGRAFAHVFAREGFDVFLVARDADALADVASRIRFEADVQVRYASMDLTKPGAASTLVDTVSSSVDVLVNCAGVGVFGRFSEYPWARDENLLALNVSVLSELCKYYSQHMLERGFGRILNVSSVAAFLPGPYMSTYYASKAYVKSFSESLAEELAGSDVSVTCLCPGPTHSGFARHAGAESSLLFSGSLATPGEVAEQGYKAMLAGKRVVVVGWKNKFNVFLTKFLPRSVQARIVRRLSEE